jgi:PPE-repeat protein
MDYGSLPPEVNSGRMYAGPGSESMLGAAAAWDALAGQLRSAAASYSSVISGLTATWQGPSSASMAAAATPYVAWMNTTAVQAEQTAGQARAAAAAYETAFAATVPPPVVTANRTQLASLLATNILGQNLSAIAATEAQYADMWAQDAAAMYGYAAQSATASQVTPFTAPPHTTNAAAAAAQATGTSAGAGAQSALAGPASLIAAVPGGLQALAAPAASPPSSLLSAFLLDVVNPFGTLSPFERGLEVFELVGPSTMPVRNALVSSTLGFGLATRGFTTGELPVPLVPGVLYPPVAGPAAAGAALSAEVGRAGLVGGLSVPPSWAVATPAVRLAATVLQGTGSAAAPLVAAESAGGLLGQLGLASAAGALGSAVPRAVTATNAQAKGSGSRDDKSSSGDDKDSSVEDKDSKKADKLKRVLAELSQKPESVQHWHTDKANLEGLLEQLSTRPGVHAVHVSSRHKPTPPQPRWG